jgi:hypothetical protein
MNDRIELLKASLGEKDDYIEEVQAMKNMEINHLKEKVTVLQNSLEALVYNIKGLCVNKVRKKRRLI